MIRKIIGILVLSSALLLPGCQQGGGSPGGDAKSKDHSLERVQRAGVLLWGADVVGGVPYVYEDPDHPGTYIGFEYDLANAIAAQLGVKCTLVIKAWDTLIPELQRGSFDMAMNGIEDTEDRGKMVLFSNPYFVYSQQLTVQQVSQGISGLENLKGKKVATLSGTAAEDILRGTDGITVVTYPEIIYSYQDLEKGKIDAVLLDTPIAAAYGATNPNLKNVGESFGEGRYVIALRLEDSLLRQAIDDALQTLKTNGTLATIYKKWGILDSHQSGIGVS